MTADLASRNKMLAARESALDATQSDLALLRGVSDEMTVSVRQSSAKAAEFQQRLQEEARAHELLERRAKEEAAVAAVRRGELVEAEAKSEAEMRARAFELEEL